MTNLNGRVKGGVLFLQLHNSPDVTVGVGLRVGHNESRSLDFDPGVRLHSMDPSPRAVLAAFPGTLAGARWRWGSQDYSPREVPASQAVASHTSPGSNELLCIWLVKADLLRRQGRAGPGAGEPLGPGGFDRRLWTRCGQ